MPPPAEDDPLQTLRERVRATQEAVERLASEAAHARAEAAGDPAAQAATDSGVPRAGAEATGELQALVALVDILRGLLPPDLQAQVTELIRQLLLLIRAILDWWIERMDHRSGGSTPPIVEDIEIT